MRFYQILAAYYDTIFPFSGSKEQFFLDLIANKPSSSALDLGCATGALVGLLTRLNWTAVGVDLSPDLIRLARQQHPGTFLQEDMLGFLERSEKEYELIVCIGNTLPHLPKENLKLFLTLATKHLNPGGKLILQAVNYHKILTDRPPGLPTIKRQEEGVTFTRLYEYNQDGSITFSSILETPQGSEKSDVTLWPFSHQDIRELLPPKLTIEAEYGSFDKESYNPQESSAWVLQATKN